MDPLQDYFDQLVNVDELDDVSQVGYLCRICSYVNCYAGCGMWNVECDGATFHVSLVCRVMSCITLYDVLHRHMISCV